MAHQCWNDGTDRSTLPIHGTGGIGNSNATPVVVPRDRSFFFEATIVRFASIKMQSISPESLSHGSHDTQNARRVPGVGEIDFLQL